MSEENQPNEGEQQFNPITSQEQLNRLIGERINQVKSQFADYDDIKTKASQFDQLQEASKTELEREREARTKAEQERDQARIDSIKAKVAAEKGVPISAITGADENAMREAADSLLQWRKDADKHFNTGTTRSTGFASGATGSGAEAGATKKEQAAAALRELRHSD